MSQTWNSLFFFQSASQAHLSKPTLSVFNTVGQDTYSAIGADSHSDCCRQSVCSQHRRFLPDGVFKFFDLLQVSPGHSVKATLSVFNTVGQDAYSAIGADSRSDCCRQGACFQHRRFLPDGILLSAIQVVLSSKSAPIGLRHRISLPKESMFSRAPLHPVQNLLTNPITRSPCA